MHQPQTQQRGHISTVFKWRFVGTVLVISALCEYLPAQYFFCPRIEKEKGGIFALRVLKQISQISAVLTRSVTFRHRSAKEAMDDYDDQTLRSEAEDAGLPDIQSWFSFKQTKTNKLAVVDQFVINYFCYELCDFRANFFFRKKTANFSPPNTQ